MKWFEKCILELTHHNLFESTDHRNRFRDLVSCYYQAPFFTKGLCKCMYLSSWDEEHFMEILSVINEMVINGDQDLRFMNSQAELLSGQFSDQDDEFYRLAVAFTTNTAYALPDFAALDPDCAHIIRRTILAAQYIDDLPDPSVETAAK